MNQWHVTVLDATAPFAVDGEKVHVTWRTVAPFCLMSIVALLNVTSVMASLQFELGQPGAPATIGGGAFVVREKLALPFLIALAGIACVPVRETSAGF